MSDGAGGWRAAQWGSRIQPIGPVMIEDPPDPPLSVCFALVKASKPELVVQKLTETGIDHIIPFVAERSVVQWDQARAGRAVERLRAVGRAAAMQSKRAWLPRVDDVSAFSDVAAAPATVMADLGGRSPTRGDLRVLIGPEGGWSDTERGRQLECVTFGSHVLRAETAAIAVGAILVALRDGVVAPSGPRDRDGG